jgi:16S rRNA (cytidine1402-2'-O)-methyltransferase
MCSDASDQVSHVERSPDLRGTLFVCATPIGNLEDLSPRVERLLRECDIVAAERPSHTRKLLSHLGIPSAKLRPCAEGTGEGGLRSLVEAIRAGRSVALVSDAGTPGISDPGWRLVAMAAAAGCPTRAVPGPSSLAAALSVAGFPCEPTLFLGFAPRKPGERRRALESGLDSAATLVLFESPERVRTTLADLAELAPTRALCITRETTKLHEEILRGSAHELLALLPAKPIGEITLVVAPPTDEDLAARECRRDSDLSDRIRALYAEGVTPRGIVRALVLLAGISRNRATRLVRGALPEAPGEDAARDDTATEDDE